MERVLTFTTHSLFYIIISIILGNLIDLFYSSYINDLFLNVTLQLITNLVIIYIVYRVYFIYFEMHWERSLAVVFFLTFFFNVQINLYPKIRKLYKKIIL